MERIQPKSKSKEQYTREFVVSANEVQKTIGPPSYAGTVQPIREAVITNLIGMSDRRDPQWGMLWMILNTANAALFPGGPQAQIQPTAHPGDIIPWVQPTTQRAAHQTTTHKPHTPRPTQPAQHPTTTTRTHIHAWGIHTSITLNRR